MPLSEKKKASNQRWDSANLSRKSVALPNALNDRLQKYLSVSGESFNGLVVRLLTDLLEEHKEPEA